MFQRSSRGRPLNAPAAFIHPCQPVVAKQPPTGPGWAHELKHDGYLSAMVGCVSTIHLIKLVEFLFRSYIVSPEDRLCRNPQCIAPFAAKASTKYGSSLPVRRYSFAMNAWQFVTRSFVTRARLDAGCDHFYESPSVGPSKKNFVPGIRTEGRQCSKGK
jgi:hypothetical protein